MEHWCDTQTKEITPSASQSFGSDLIAGSNGGVGAGEDRLSYSLYM